MTNQNRPIDASVRERGLALLVALVVLAALSLAGIALIRSVDTSSLIAGNIAFRQSATLAGDAGVEAARTFLLKAGKVPLENDNASEGYYATSQDAIDLTGNRTPKSTSDDVPWGAAGTKCIAADAAGNSVCYVVHRLCNTAGPISVLTCSTESSSTSGVGSDLDGTDQTALTKEATYQLDPKEAPTSASGTAEVVYYRITVRITGPRNNSSFIQAFVLI